jgi:hypothetical protein
VFCINFSTHIFLNIFLHICVVCASNLIGADILEHFRLSCFVVMIMHLCFININISLNPFGFDTQVIPRS